LGKPRVFGRFIAHNSTRVVLREPESEDLEGLLAFVNELVTEKKEDKNSQLFTGFES